jgi:6-phosphofructokinase 1
VELLMRGETDRMVAFHPPSIGSVPLADIVGKTRTVPLDFDVVQTARAIGVSLGD